MSALGALRFILKAVNLCLLFLGVSLLTYGSLIWHEFRSSASAEPTTSTPWCATLCVGHPSAC